MGEIVVYLDLFAAESRIHILKNGEEKEEIYTSSVPAKLAKDLVIVAYHANIYDVRVCCPAVILPEIIDATSNYEMTTYNQNKINITKV